MMPNRSNKMLIFPFILATFIAMAYVFYDELFFNREFNGKIWNEKTYDNEVACVRGKMVHDIFENHMRLGDSRAKVENLLGSSDYKIEPAYVLGECSGFDLSVLHLDYDDQEKLRKYEVEQH